MFCGHFVSLLHYIWVCIQFLQIESSTMVEIKLERFTVPDGNDMVGQPCDNSVAGLCDPYFSICFDQPDGDDNFGRCTYKLITTSWYQDKNTIVFGNVINGGVENPIKLSIPEWKGGIGIKVDVTDKDIQLDDPIDNLFYTYNQIPFRSERFAIWKDVTMKGNRRRAQKTILLLNIKVYCEQDWYGSDCSVKCEPRNGYMCDVNTGQLICNPGSRCNIPGTMKTTITTTCPVKTSTISVNTNPPQNGGMSAGSAVGVTLGVVVITVAIVFLVVLYIKAKRDGNAEQILPESNTEQSWTLSRRFWVFIIRITRGKPVNPDTIVLPVDDREEIPALPAAEQRALPSTENTISSPSVTEIQGQL